MESILNIGYRDNFTRYPEGCPAVLILLAGGDKRTQER